MPLYSMPFCSLTSRQAGLWYLAARWRYTTPLTTIGKKLLKRPPRDAMHNDVVLF